MVWPSRIYVATTALGVYYTEDFVDPSTQPTWTAVNDGLPAMDCYEFWLDPFNPAVRQYVLLGTSGTLYRRENGGTWESILTSAQAGSLVEDEGSILRGFCADPSVSGRLWATYGYTGFAGTGLYALYSDDYGDSWTAVTALRTGIYLYGLSSIRAHGDTVYVSASTNAGAQGSVYFSVNRGITWSRYSNDFNWLAPLLFNPLLPDQVYVTGDSAGNYDLRRVTSVGSAVVLQDGLGPLRWDGMWFDPSNADHQRLLRSGAVYVTNDEWATVNSPSAVTPTPYSFAPWAGDDTDQMLVSMEIGGGDNPAQSHVIGALYGDDDVTAIGIAGEHSRYAPFDDSIPYTCGGAARMGIQAIPEAVPIPPAPSPVEIAPTQGLIRAMIWDRFGRGIAEVQCDIGPVSWILNGVGRASLTMAATDPKATAEILQIGNRVLLQFGNGLPDWGGVIDLPRAWSGGTISVACYGIERLLDYRVTEKNSSFYEQPVGAIFQSLLEMEEQQDPLGIVAGSIWMGGHPHWPRYHYKSLWYVLDYSVRRMERCDYRFIPYVNAEHFLRFRADLFQQAGADKTTSVALVEGRNTAASLRLEEQGGVINTHVAVGEGSTWGTERLTVAARDTDSIAAYGLRETANVYAGVSMQATLEMHAAAVVNTNSRPRRIFSLEVTNHRPGGFGDYDLGDTISCVLPSFGFGGFDGAVRVLAREYDPKSGVCRLVVEEPHATEPWIYSEDLEAE